MWLQSITLSLWTEFFSRVSGFLAEYCRTVWQTLKIWSPFCRMVASNGLAFTFKLSERRIIVDNMLGFTCCMLCVVQTRCWFRMYDNSSSTTQPCVFHLFQQSTTRHSQHCLSNIKLRSVTRALIGQQVPNPHLNSQSEAASQVPVRSETCFLQTNAIFFLF